MCGLPFGAELEVYKRLISYEMTLAAEVRLWGSGSVVSFRRAT